MLFVVNFQVFNEAVEDDKKDGVALNRIHYLKVGDVYELYFKNYYTVLTVDSILNSGVWDSEEGFVMNYLRDAFEIIRVKSDLMPSFKIVSD